MYGVSGYKGTYSYNGRGFVQLMTVLADEPGEPATSGLVFSEGSHPHAKRRDEIVFELCEGLIDMTAALFSVSSRELRKAQRTSAPVTRVRQIAMYVAHVVLQFTQGEIGRAFGRDRTTVVHACHLIEDMRDDAEFDPLVLVVERIASAAFRDRLGR